MTDYGKLFKELDAEGGHYCNRAVLRAKDVEGVEPNSNGLSVKDKRAVTRLVDARSDLLADMDRAIHAEGLWYSHGLRSYVVMFDSPAKRLDSVCEDWRLAYTKASILLDMLREDPSFRDCPAPSVHKVLDALEEFMEDARKHGRMEGGQ